MAKKYIIDHINSHKLKSYALEINKDLFNSVKAQHQKKTDLENQETLISKKYRTS